MSGGAADERSTPRAPLSIGGVTVAPGERRRVEIRVAQLYGLADVHLPVVVQHGRRPGPRLFVSAAVHGDEINGIEIIRRLLRMPRIRRVAGTLIAVPIVNVYGFLTNSRYLPDRRDLNRTFPGSEKGSLSARLAFVFMQEVVSNATHGIDLHTAAVHRDNLPQVRACLDDSPTKRLARVFGAPVVLNAKLRDGSLRQAVLERQMPMLLYEAGEALRFDEVAIRAGVRGVLNVMADIGMLRSRPTAGASAAVLARSSHWVRAPESGLLRSAAALGARIRAGERLGTVSDPVTARETPVTAPSAGLVIGRTRLPLVNEGDALFHVATFRRTSAAEAAVDAVRDSLDPEMTEGPSRQPPIR